VGLICSAWVVMNASAAQAQSSAVLVSTVEGPITPVVADHLRDGVDRAESENHAAYVVELDTPGGLDAAMRDIVQSFLTSPVPVVVYVAPDGARAASAGAVITLASHVAAMAPGTAIGAATPVDLQGGDISEKVINDAAAYAESLAELRERNVAFAGDAVREGRSATAREAVELGAVDLIASSRAQLLATIHGTVIELSDGSSLTLSTRSARIVAHELGTFRQVLQWLADPNLVFLFMSIGTLAIIYELANPGVGVAGIIGVILVVLALAALSVLPVDAVGAILLVVAAGLFIAELFAPGIGVFAFGGTAALLLGGVFLFRGGVQVDPIVLLPTGILTGGSTVLVAHLVARSRRLRPASGRHAIVGQRGMVRVGDGTSGQVTIEGIWWKARTEEQPLKPGAWVRVVGIQGLDLIVEPEEKSQ
jgi:membrane-bound serine protease (ClpP class)